MADQGSPRRFARIDRLPPYVFNITAELKMAARRRGEDIIDLSMGNPDGATPPHIVEKLVTVAQREDTHGYSTSKGIPRLRRAISNWYKDRYATSGINGPDAPRAPMPYALFFAGDIAVHYSPTFAASGYYPGGGSHGCVNVADLKGVSWLFDQIPVGTLVHVYWG